MPENFLGNFQLNENLHKLSCKLVELNFFSDMLVSWIKLHNKQRHLAGNDVTLLPRRHFDCSGSFHFL